MILFLVFTRICIFLIVDTISFLLGSSNAELVKELQQCLRNMKDLPKILTKIRNVNASINDWKALYQVCETIPIEYNQDMYNNNNPFPLSHRQHSMH